MSNSDLIATCSAFVALLAFVVTIFQLLAAQKHNRLSVRPWLAWNVSRSNADDGCTITYSLRNQGLGPAIVKDRYFSLGGEKFKTEGSVAFMVEECVRQLIGDKFKYRLLRHGLPGCNIPMPVMAEVVIAELFFPGMSDSQIDDMEATLPDLHFHVSFESMYGEKYTFSTNDAGVPVGQGKVR